jgi:GTPase SAR1 family protein
MLIEPDDSFDFLFKIVLIGDMGVGKTCCVQRFKNGTFIERQGTTIGVDFTMKTLIIDGKRVKVGGYRMGVCLRMVFCSYKSGTPAAKSAFEQSLNHTIAVRTVWSSAMILHPKNRL